MFARIGYGSALLRVSTFKLGSTFPGVKNYRIHYGYMTF